MDLAQLRYFQATAQTENLTQAANQLFIAPSALSVSISRLEKELGVTLFDRVGRRLCLNSRGMAFLERINAILSSLDYAVSEVIDMEKKQETALFIASTSPNIFQAAFLSFLQTNKQYKLSHTALRIDQVHPADLLHRFDFVLASPQDFHLSSQLCSRILYNTDYAVLVMHPEHPLAKYTQIDLHAVKDEPFVTLSPGYSSRKFFDEVCSFAGFTPKIVMECDYTMRSYMVMQKAGITIATAHTRILNHCGGAVAIKINPPFTSRTQAIYWDPNRYQTQASRDFLEHICGFYKDFSFELP